MANKQKLEITWIGKENIKALHVPKEFEKIKFAKCQILITKVSDKSDINISQMSTGQRISLALSVMFCLHLAAPNSPDFILLDEPVANLDGLHVLNLLDILRDFALNGTQIFFTTANPDVAGIFRRKFSFFGPDFKDYKMTRKDNGFATVKVYNFDPEKELGIELPNAS